MLQGNLDVEVSKICYDSKKAEAGVVFVCVQGTLQDGHDFVEDAIQNGATAVLCSKALICQDGVTVIQTEDCRKALSMMSSAFYQNPASKLKLIGITGTKGKTSTAFMIRSILQKADIGCGLIGTVMVDTGLRQIDSSQTTPSPLELHQYLWEMLESGYQWAVMEVSSQALKQHRVDGIQFDIGIFTNAEEDHIGPLEHESFDEYLSWKSLLFKQSKIGIVNGDDPYCNDILDAHCCERVETFGMNKELDFYGENLSYIRLEDRFAVEFQTKGLYNIKLVIGGVGVFSAYNAMAAVLAAKEVGVSDLNLQQALTDFVVPGRQEMIFTGFGGIVLVDYAHNGMSLTALLQELRRYNPKKITCVFGCGGQRDRNRRFQMGEAAAKYADFSVITSDNPRNESPTDIISDIINRMEFFHGNYSVLEDRHEAIAFAVRKSIPGEVVVIAGKGHENYQLIGNRKLHFDDREEVRNTIEKVNYEQNNHRRN